MPNTAIAIQESMTCVASRAKDRAHEQLVLSIFERLGRAVVIDEVGGHTQAVVK